MNPVDIPRIDLNLLAVFQAIYAERHLTRAGNRLGLTQPAMSHALNRLRGLFDDALFVRTAAGMEPTPRAHQIAEPVGAALAQVRRALARPDRFDPATARQAFRLSMLDYETAVVVPPLAACFAATAPGIDLRIRHARRTDALDLLDRNELDVALGLFDDLPARFEPRALFDESFAVIARADHPDLSGGLTLDAYVRLPHLLVSFDGTPHGTIDDVLARGRSGTPRRLDPALFPDRPARDRGHRHDRDPARADRRAVPANPRHRRAAPARHPARLHPFGCPAPALGRRSGGAMAARYPGKRDAGGRK
jgi:DNA-binding transcriptional LysR family regulator